MRRHSKLRRMRSQRLMTAPAAPVYLGSSLHTHLSHTMGFVEATQAAVASTGALEVPIYFLLFNIAWTWILAEITGNASQVDRVWTFLPFIYTAWFAALPALALAPPGAVGYSSRAVLMAALQVCPFFNRLCI